MMSTLKFRQSSLRNFLYVIFKRKIQIMIFLILTVGAITIATVVVKPTYEATAQILVKIGRENPYNPPNRTSNQVTNFSSDDQINAEIELLKGRFLTESVIESLGLQTIYKHLDHTDAVLHFQKSLSIEGIKKSNLITIRFKHHDPKTAAIIVNTLANAYRDQHLLVHKTPQLYNFFEEQSKILKTKLKQAEQTLKAFKRRNNVTALDEEQRLLLGQMAELRTELNRTLSQELETRNRITETQRQLDKTPKSIPQGEKIDHSALLISNLEAKLIELELRGKKLSAKYTPRSPLIQNVKEEITMVREKLGQQEAKRNRKSRIRTNTTYQRLQEELFRNQAEQQALAAKKDTQYTQLTDYQKKLEQFSRIEGELNQYQQTVEVAHQNYLLYLNKFEESRISDAIDSKKIANVSLVEPALPPRKQVSPNVFLNIVLSLFLGGFGGLGLAFFRDYLEDRLEKPEDVEEALQTPVLASIPELRITK